MALGVLNQLVALIQSMSLCACVAGAVSSSICELRV